MASVVATREVSRSRPSHLRQPMPAPYHACAVVRRVGPYVEYAPPRALADVVDAVWIYSVRATRMPLHVPPHRILPELGLSLFFHCERDAAGRVLDGALSLQGPIRTLQRFTAARAVHLEAVRIGPEWSRTLLGVDATEQADAIQPYEIVRRTRARRLYDRLCATRSSRQSVELLLAEVSELHAAIRAHGVHGHASRCTQLLRAASGHRFEDLARAAGLSERQFRRVVHASTGLSPKQFQRVHRLNHAVALADRVSQPRWARIAALAGYYDQSHFIQECIALTGLPPAALHGERQAENLPELIG